MKPIDPTLVERIRREKGLPLIGVVGATVPTAPYRPKIGQQVGYNLRAYNSTVGGALFTGGVEGIGVDVYVGIMRYCIDVAKRTGDLKEDNFFVLVPTHTMAPFSIDLPRFRRKAIPPLLHYSPPAEYSVLGSLTPKGGLDVVRAGENMTERREYVGAVADTLVVVNGGDGTLDEVIQAMQLGKKIITLPESGGTAALLGTIKKKPADPGLRQTLAKMRISEQEINPDLIYVATDTKMILTCLGRIL